MTAVLDRVEPLHLWVPPRAGSLVVPVGRLCNALGEQLDPEQEQAVDTLTSVRADGYPAKMSGVIIAARQNLKTYCLERIVLTLLLKPDVPGMQKTELFVWSAHEFDTARETFAHFDAWIDEHEWLAKTIEPGWPHRGSGKEEIRFRNGRRLKFKARSKSGSRGLAGDVVVLDEAYALMPEHMGAIVPILSTRRQARLYYGSSAGRAESNVLRDQRDAGRAGGPGAPAYIEFAAPLTACQEEYCRHKPGQEEGCALDRRDLVQLANPSAGKRISWEYLEEERTLLTPEEYARERLGWWDEPEGEAPLTREMFARGILPESLALGRPAYGIDSSPRLKSTAILAATWSPDGRPHVEVIEHGSGSTWAIDRLQQLRKKRRGPIMMSSSSPAAALLPSLMKLRIPVTMVPDTELASACSDLEAMFRDGAAGIEHLGDPILDRALMGAMGRPHGDGGWLWTRKTSASDISPLVAMTTSVVGLRKLIRKGSGDPRGGVG